MYTIKVSRSPEGKDGVVYEAKEYEITQGVLKLFLDDDHDLVVPLFQVATVDIQRQK